MRPKHDQTQSEFDAVVSFPGSDKLTAEQALRASIDSNVFASLHELASLHGGRAVQAVYTVLLRRLPNVHPDRKRIAIDSGHSESSVKRAIALLEKCGLIRVNRQRGKHSVYHITDLRHAGHVTECLSGIRRLRNGVANNSRLTSDPTPKSSRATSDPCGQVTGELQAGSLVNQKETTKIPKKQQDANAARSMKNTPITKYCSHTVALSRWGLSGASYLVKPGHPKAVPELISAGLSASELIEITMRSTEWSPGAGTGARVAYLREHVHESVRELKRRSAQRQANQEATEKRALKAISHLKSAKGTLPKETDEIDRELLTERALKRLNEPPEVIDCIRQDPSACELLARNERRWDQVAQRIESLSNEDYSALCERLFEQKPGVQRFYEHATRDSPLLRAQLTQLLIDEAPD
jgi:hypothetical protein